jgi:hypothetical protein
MLKCCRASPNSAHAPDANLQRQEQQGPILLGGGLSALADALFLGYKGRSLAAQTHRGSYCVLLLFSEDSPQEPRLTAILVSLPVQRY